MDVIDTAKKFIYGYHHSILQQLLQDKSTGRNIRRVVNVFGPADTVKEEWEEITSPLFMGEKSAPILPRSAKSKLEQEQRTRAKAEVFTPCWVCNKQNNLIDAQWFGREGVFNVEHETSWQAVSEKISFPSEKKSWKKYVDAQRLEITCGEAPYLVSRYDSVTGSMIPLGERIGFLDRKLRIVEENASSDAEWEEWSIRALQSVFGYEYQGDSLLLARENMLFSYIDYYEAHFGKKPEKKLLEKIANIIVWNLWQMDGLKYVVPGSCHKEPHNQISIFSEALTAECPGCRYNDPHQHNGIYCKIHDWRRKRTVRFIDMMKGAKP